jgi:integrase
MAGVRVKADDVIAGLQLHTWESGRKSYYFYYRTRAGVERRPKIGDAASMSINEARKIARILGAKVALGEDPKGEWDAEKKQKTVAELFDLAFEKHWGKNKNSRWPEEVARLYRQTIEPHFAHTKISQVSQTDVKAWFSTIDSKFTANRSLRVLHKLFSFAVDEQFVDANPCQGVKHYKEKARSRFASEEEMGKIIDYLAKFMDDPQHQIPAVYFYSLAMTGCRPRDLEKATWEAFNGGRLTINGKTGVETIVIPENVLEVWNKLPSAQVKTGGIFPSKFPRYFWMKLQKDLDLKDLWARDLRRSFASFALSKGVPIGVIGELLNHKSAQTTKIYAKLLKGDRDKAAADTAKAISEVSLQLVRRSN